MRLGDIKEGEGGFTPLDISTEDVIELQENPAQFPIKSSLRVVFVRRNS